VQADDKLISRLQLFSSAVIVAVMSLGMGLLFILQLRQEYDASLKAIEAQETQRQQETLTRQVETAKGFLETLRARTEAVLKHQIREQVDQAYDIAQTIHDQNQGRQSDTEIKRTILETLRPLRFFDGKGYFFVDGLDGKCLLLPINRDREGTSLLENRDDTGTYIMRSLIDAAKAPVGDGYSRYRWYAPGDGKKMQEKIAYVRTFQPYGWVIGTGMYLADVESTLQAEARERLRDFRFGPGGKGYFVLYSEDGKVLISPSRPGNENKPIETLSEESRVVAQMIFEKGNMGGGFLRYDWSQEENPQKRSTKLVYVSKMPGWNWIVSAGFYLDDEKAAADERRAHLEESINRKMALTIAAMVVGVGISLAIGWWFSGLTRRVMERYKSDIARQNAELERKTHALEQSNTDLEQFAYVASHDLREPLRMISAYITLIERNYTAHFDEEGHQFLAFARDGAKRMDQLVLDLLQFSRIDRMGAPIEPMNLSVAVRNAITNLALTIAETDGIVTVPPQIEDVWVMGDVHQITRLLQNLIGNAIKYRRPGHPPEIGLSAEPRPSGFWTIAVKDNGEGIDERFFERIFGIFQRLHGRDFEGTGIGLAVCRRIVERHQGRIWLESAPGQGSKFYFTLPEAKAKTEKKPI
jgi:signal transduction histidine kinase